MEKAVHVRVGTGGKREISITFDFAMNIKLLKKQSF
jgi:hypothetical protein